MFVTDGVYRLSRQFKNHKGFNIRQRIKTYLEGIVDLLYVAKDEICFIREGKFDLDV